MTSPIHLLLFLVLSCPLIVADETPTSSVYFEFMRSVKNQGVIYGTGTANTTSNYNLLVTVDAASALFNFQVQFELRTATADPQHPTTSQPCHKYEKCNLLLTRGDMNVELFVLIGTSTDPTADTAVFSFTTANYLLTPPSTCSDDQDDTKHAYYCLCPLNEANPACGNTRTMDCNEVTLKATQIFGKTYNKATIGFKQIQLQQSTNAQYFTFIWFQSHVANAVFKPVDGENQLVPSTTHPFDAEISYAKRQGDNQPGEVDVFVNFDPSLAQVVLFENSSCSFGDDNELTCTCEPDPVGSTTTSTTPTTTPSTTTQTTTPTTHTTTHPTTTKPTTTQPTTTTKPIPTETTAHTTLATSTVFPVLQNQCDDPDAADSPLCTILVNETITNDNLDQTVDQVQKAFDPQTASSDTVVVVSQLISRMAVVENATGEQRVNVLSVVDSVLHVSADQFAADDGAALSETLRKSVDLIAEQAAELSFLNGSQFGVHKQPVDCNEAAEWVGLSDHGDRFSADAHDGARATIQLGTKALCHEESASPAPYFVIYRSSKLFQDGAQKTSRRKREVVGETNEKCGADFQPTNNLVLTGVNPNGGEKSFDRPLHSEVVVTWWDDGRQEWATNRQCPLEEVGDELVARCDHLTDFALLVQRSTGDPVLCDRFVERLGFWLTICSAGCLFVLVVVYATRWLPGLNNEWILLLNNRRAAHADYLLVFYVLVLFVFYLLFVTLVDETTTGSRAACMTVAGLLYGFFLMSLLLNAFQALNLLKICATSSRTEQILSRVLAWYIVVPICIGIPAIVCTTIGFAKSSFFYRGDHFCWIRPESVLYAVLVPASLMLLNSCVAFAFFCCRMFPNTLLARHLGRASSVRMSLGSRNKRRDSLQLFLTVLFTQVLLGLPWVLQYPAMFSKDATVWHVLFTVFNGSNGIFILLMFVYGRAHALIRLHSDSSVGSTSSTVAHSKRKTSD
ncbi:G-PROTEIN-RECEP-F2-4 domain-containing protein [Aphelenchoides fujianensis]|nr:G-PROTEIN-RECEP-F2-4 domain-containing protein [Aphelenchoides fujianensis]